MSTLCIEAVVGSREEYAQGVKKLAMLVKPGGTLLLFGGEIKGEEGFYIVGEKKFKAFGVATDVAVEALANAGVSVVNLKMLTDVPQDVEESRVMSFVFIQGIKDSNH